MKNGSGTTNTATTCLDTNATVTPKDVVTVVVIVIGFFTLILSKGDGFSYIFLPLTNLLGLPPVSVLLREIRPKVLFLLLTFLFIFRLYNNNTNASSTDAESSSSFMENFLWLQNSKQMLENDNNNNNNNSQNLSFPFLQQHGLLDYVVLQIYRGMAYFFMVLENMIGASPPPPQQEGGGGGVQEQMKILLLPLTRIASLVLNDALGLVVLHALFQMVQTIRRWTLREMQSATIKSGFEFLHRNISFVKSELQKEEEKLRISLETDIKDPKRNITSILPSQGCDHSVLIKQLNQQGKKENEKWEQGRVSGAVYCGEEEHTNLMNAAYAAFSLSNPLHPDIWPTVNQMEAEVCSMTASFLNGGDTRVVGCMTSGGTESIVMAAKAHREYFGRRRGIRNAEIISCVTGHAGIDKACDIMGIRGVKVRCHPETFQMDVKAVESCISADTIMIFASAPCFAQGIIDPIEELSKLAIKYQVGLHVDCCLGGFVLPFIKRMGGYDIPNFDFSVPGVTSMSCDTHKYGYAAKGTSVVLYRNKDIRRAQYFCYSKWTGGLYVTPTTAGSRPGALSVCAWVSMMALGEDGFTSRAKSIVDTAAYITKQIRITINGLIVFGEPKAMVVCFGSKDFDIYRVGDAMAKRGWSLNTLQRPACIHLCVTMKTVKYADQFIEELRDVVAKIVEEGNDVAANGNAAVYGKVGPLPPGPINELLKCYTDVLLAP